MYDLAVREADWVLADSLIRRKFKQEIPFGDRALFAFVRGDSAAGARILAEAPRVAGRRGRRLRSADLEAGRWVAIYLENLPTSEQFVRLSANPAQDVALQSSAHLALGSLALAGGRWTAAKAEFAAAERLGQTDSARVSRGLGAILPFLDIPRPDLEAIRSEIEQWEPGEDLPDAPTGPARALRPHLRLYLLGMLSSRLGAPATALRGAAELERLSAPPDAHALVRGLAHTVRADVARRSGHAAEALAALEEVRGEVSLELIGLPAFSEEHARYLRAQVLHQQGRDEEALRWLEAGFQGTPNELVYLAPAHLLRGQIYDRLGDKKQAVEQYSRFVRLWRDCDPAQGTIVEGAKAQLGQLVGEPQ
jgi:tetratricopeptide (TPR) repeat protein